MDVTIHDSETSSVQYGSDHLKRFLHFLSGKPTLVYAARCMPDILA